MGRKWLIAVAVLAAVSVTASAQTTQPAESEPIKARQKIFMMEGVLERAVQLGVDNMRRRVRAVMPDDALLQGGAPQVRGFRLDGYGVFFDVEVPSLRRSFAWSMRTMNETGAVLARDLAQMRAFVQAIPDQRLRAEYDRLVQRIQRQMGPPPPAAADRVAAQGVAAPGTVSAQSLPTPPAPAAPAAVGTASGAQVDSLLLNDPSEAYTQEVKAALIDAMIENSGPLVLGADDWLTIAARDNAPSDPLLAGDQMTLVLRVRGSDLNAYRAGKLTLDQVRTRVQAGQF